MGGGGLTGVVKQGEQYGGYYIDRSDSVSLDAFTEMIRVEFTHDDNWYAAEEAIQ
jgi:hypothetical protein